MDLFERGSIEIAEAELDRFIERRAREAGEAELIEVAWAESVRFHHARQRETNREAWCDFHRHMERLHASLSEEHRAKALNFLDERGEGAVLQR